ncbi:MAG: cell division protein FtsK/SpoIIIE, partial [Pseudonocardia sp.]|nr:cell division protein FtsK/SpoIIIE [Pseudonocardia sp.]
MSRRAERRARIVAAFDELRTAVASALGAATAHREHAVREHARAMFEYWMRVDGLPPQLDTDPVLRRGIANPVLTETVQRIQLDRTVAFEPWVSTGPQRLADLVADAAPGAAGEHPDQWLGQPGKADGAPPVPQLWRIGHAMAGGVAGGAPAHESFPVAVPLLDE